ncbi:MAG TPA: biosynthetic peptidoglycan transglycosylase [Caulobacteraceae bacterium]|nr:biosynthetic peptidoglycan transglycosylase [Caulobacteraceae bacterium]
MRSDRSARRPRAATANPPLRRPRLLGRIEADLDQVVRAARPVADEGAAVLSPLEIMTIALEDRRFFVHSGVDLRSVARELVKATRFRPHGGASTIDMQFVRTVTGFRRHSIRRKLYEALLALGLRSRCGKIAILRAYLACAYFGTGLVGADAAAQKVFGKAAGMLEVDEAALVSAMLACPRPLSGSTEWEARARRRATYGLEIFAANRRRLAGPHSLAAGL